MSDGIPNQVEFRISHLFDTDASRLFLDPGSHVYSTERISNENPSFVVSNGKVGVLTGDDALKIQVGEKVRFFYGQANDMSGFA